MFNRAIKYLKNRKLILLLRIVFVFVITFYFSLALIQIDMSKELTDRAGSEQSTFYYIYFDNEYGYGTEDINESIEILEESGLVDTFNDYSIWQGRIISDGYAYRVMPVVIDKEYINMRTDAQLYVDPDSFVTFDLGRELNEDEIGFYLPKALYDSYDLPLGESYGFVQDVYSEPVQNIVFVGTFDWIHDTAYDVMLANSGGSEAELARQEPIIYTAVENIDNVWKNQTYQNELFLPKDGVTVDDMNQALKDAGNDGMIEEYTRDRIEYGMFNFYRAPYNYILFMIGVLFVMVFILEFLMQRLRSKEFGILLALGERPRNIYFQQCIESLLVFVLPLITVFVLGPRILLIINYNLTGINIRGPFFPIIAYIVITLSVLLVTLVVNAILFKWLNRKSPKEILL